MAAVAGVSYSSVQRIWRAHGLKPHLVETFKVSRDKNFAAKVEDVVGLYLNPPDKALVLCVDEKSCPALMRHVYRIRPEPELAARHPAAGELSLTAARSGSAR